MISFQFCTWHAWKSFEGAREVSPSGTVFQATFTTSFCSFDNSLQQLQPADHDNVIFGTDGVPLRKFLSDKLDSVVATAFFTDSRAASRSSESDQDVSLGSWLLSRISSQLPDVQERSYASQITRGLSGWTGAELEEVSFRYWGFEREFEGGDAVVVGGYDKILHLLRQDIINQGGRIELGRSVQEVSFDEEEQLVRVTVGKCNLPSHCRTYVAKSCICTIPLGVMKSSEARPSFTPALPSRRLAAIDRLGFGLLDKVVLLYPRVWWPKAPGFFTILQGDGIRGTTQLPAVLTHASAREYLNTAPAWVQSYAPINGQPVLVLYLGGFSGHALEHLSDDEAKIWAHDLLKSRLPNLRSSRDEEPPQPAHCHVTRWLADPLSQGSYTYIPVSGSKRPKDLSSTTPSPLDIVELSRPLWEGRLGFAGEHTEMDCYASVHGAAISGWREGTRVKVALEEALHEGNRENTNH
jgi:hypothetical protein